MVNILNITRPIIAFISKNKGIILSVGTAILAESIRPSNTCTVFDVPNYRHMFMQPRNSLESSIFAIMKNGESASWDSDKLQAAKDIMKILKAHMDAPIKDETVSFAIEALHNIAESSSWNSTKKQINSYIANIGEHVKFKE